MHLEIAIDKDYTFTWKRYEMNAQVVPTASTVTVYDQAGDELQTGSGTIDSDGTVSFTYLAANNEDIDRNLKVVNSWTYDGIVTDSPRLFDVVNYPLENLVIDDDLFDRIEELREKLYTKDGSTTSVTSNDEINDTSLSVDNRDWTNARGEFFYLNSQGVNEVYQFKVDVYDSSLSQLKLNLNMPAIVEGDKYIIRQTYTKQIQTAFDQVQNTLRNKVGLASGYLDSTVIKELTIFKALEIVCIAKVQEETDRWKLKADYFRNEYETKQTSFYESYDFDEGGTITDVEEESKPSGFTTSLSDDYGRV